MYGNALVRSTSLHDKMIQTSNENAPCEDRTHDLRIMRPTRYRLRQRSLYHQTVSYAGIRRHAVENFKLNTSDPGRIRTHNLLIWSQMRYRCATEPMLTCVKTDTKCVSMLHANQTNAVTQDRTGDLQIFSLTLSQLSYRGG